MKTLILFHERKNAALKAVLLAAIAVNLMTTGEAQTYNAGSDGSDGALNLTTGGTIVFDPFETSRWGKVLDADGDGVYNFTTVNIATGVILRLRGDRINQPIVWLASGEVVINGTLDLSGGDGATGGTDLEVRRQVAVPGPGGYAGGAGGRQTPSLPATAGEGPGGGSGSPACPQIPAASACGKAGLFVGNRSLVPLVGGSGGEGATNTTSIGGGGGAGGGAILIASSTSIFVGGNGSIRSSGGNGGINQVWTGRNGGGGSGGGVRLVAPSVVGTGLLNVSGGISEVANSGGSGWIRIEGNTVGSFSIAPSANALSRGALANPATLKPQYAIRITSIDGVAVPANPSGVFQLPDVSMNKNTPVNVAIEATGIPPGTVVTLQVYSELPNDQTVVNQTAPATLAGTLEKSTASASFTFPYGYSRCFIRTTWTP